MHTATGANALAWKPQADITGGQVSVDEGLKNCNDIINQAIAEG